MDVAAAQQVQNKCKDEVGQRCQKLFLDFLEGSVISVFDALAEHNIYVKILGLKLMERLST